MRSFLSKAAFITVWACSLGVVAHAQSSLPTKSATWTAKDFRFHTGEVLPEMKLAYTTVGDPSGEPVLVLHGTTGSSKSMLTPAFAGELFGPGQVLDAKKYFIIVPDSIGSGGSSKPSDGLRTKFPAYNYDDMVTAQYRLVTEHLGIKHLRVVLGYSMGGMQAWMWAEKYPEFMDIAVPMAAMPAPMSGRNWMLRRMLVETIRNDPQWMGGNYTTQPASWQYASVLFGLATSGGTQNLQKQAPTSDAGDAIIKQRLKSPYPGDANDHIYQWESSKDYDASKDLERIKASVLVITSADDERNPLELGVLESALPRIKRARAFVIPASSETSGHGTTVNARFWKQELAKELQATPAQGKTTP